MMENDSAGTPRNEPLAITVECYAGYRGEETPRRFQLGKRQVEIVEVVNRWLTPDHRYFKVKDVQADLYILREDVSSGQWELTFSGTAGKRLPSAGGGTRSGIVNRDSLSIQANPLKRAANLPGEFELIGRYFAPLARGFPGAFGLLDDAAVIAPLPGHELVAKSDAIVGGVHFLDDDPPNFIARKALRANLSDLAAKGAVPRAYMLDIMLPTTITEEWIAAFAQGLADDQQEYGVHLIGGDTDSTPGPVTIAIMAFGEVATGRMVHRGGARAGDIVFVTGTIGDAALGLAVLRGDVTIPDTKAADFLVDRYRLPRPRVALGPRLIGIATAAVDVSDGLVADLGHLCNASKLAAVIEAPRVPLSSAARAVLATHSWHITTVLTGGDDYEILFTAPRGAVNELAELSRTLDVPITAIGGMRSPSKGKESQVTVLDESGEPLILDRGGWTHF
jgi:thiamine-monophosphate kinase